MTKKEARQAGIEMAKEIDAYGDFTEKELSDADSYAEAFYEIVENRKQYAGEVTELFRKDSEWEGYEEGLETGLRRVLRQRNLT